jgi:hypothetical protein
MDKQTAISGETETVDLSRRETLAKLGAYAAFTVPAVSALLVSQKASALSIDVCLNGHPVVGNNCPP